MPCSSSKRYVIILACGSGKRMESNIPKQFLLLQGKPLIFHTIEKISSFDKSYNIIAVINKDHETLWNEYKEKFKLNASITTAFGGSERFFSVLNGINAIKEDNVLIAVHDGVRPFVTKQMFEKSFAVAQQYGNAVCGIQSTDSVRISTDNGNKAIDRKNVYLIQTPQTFQSGILKKAYSLPYNEKFTDDASVVEAIGEKINIIDGLKENIKITYPSDFALAERLVEILK